MIDCKGWTSQFRSVSVGKLIGALILLLGCGGAWAQTTGSLLGIVTDQGGAGVSEAKVHVRDTDTGFIKDTITATEGTYSIPLLPIGHYSVSVEAKGFKSSTKTGILIPVAQNIRVDVQLQIGAVNEAITVEGNAINIETTLNRATIRASSSLATLSPA